MTKENVEPVGVIGLGAIGSGVAHSFLVAGIPTFGCDINPNTLTTFIEAGGQPIKTPACLVKETRIVFLFVVNAKQARLVLFGENGLLDFLPKNSIIISCVTMAPTEIRAIGDQLHSFGVTV